MPSFYKTNNNFYKKRDGVYKQYSYCIVQYSIGCGGSYNIIKDQVSGIDCVCGKVRYRIWIREQ